MTNLTEHFTTLEIKKEIVRRLAFDDFYYFVKHIFARSFDEFILGDYVEDTCHFLQDNPKTIVVSARVHFKSLSLYAHVMWKILRMRYIKKDIESHYCSYKTDMAKYHVGDPLNRDNIRELIKRNPYFTDIIDNKPLAEMTLNFTWDGIASFVLKPMGMLTFKRGLHCNGAVYIDDPLQDPAEKLDPKIVYKINDVFFAQILDIPLGDRPEIHVAGTAQTKQDFYFDDRVKEEGFKVNILPGLSDIKVDDQGWILDGVPLWKEWMKLEGHKQKQRGRGIKIYAQEYLCNPAYSTDSFFKAWQFEKLKKVKPVKEFEYDSETQVIGGWDLGKHSHPAHFTAHAINSGRHRELFNKWFDGVDHTDQLSFIEGKIEDLSIDTVYYDNTRGELEILAERGDLPAELVPISFGRRLKFSLATEFEKCVTKENLEMIDDTRTVNQICLVDNDLKARTTKDGHGDSFWSFALTFAGELQAEAELYVVSGDKKK